MSFVSLVTNIIAGSIATAYNTRNSDSNWYSKIVPFRNLFRDEYLKRYPVPWNVYPNPEWPLDRVYLLKNGEFVVDNGQIQR